MDIYEQLYNLILIFDPLISYQKYIFRIIAVIFSKSLWQHEVFFSFERKISEISCWLNVIYNGVQLPRMELVETLQRVSEPTTSSEFWQQPKSRGSPDHLLT